MPLRLLSLEKVVTLYVRVWIETDASEAVIAGKGVTLYVRVWIETRCCIS